ncbi:MAG: DEAD/DEAH box helicase family protein, partial [Selenomonadales bacterium]|nr:DEAD/DEAH box helicase family protein [Selenomonadales bacterium]
MTNFDYLCSTPDFASFASVAVSAERLLHIDRDACVINCRRAMEFAVKWMYAVDRDLDMPYQDNLDSLMKDATFRGIIGDDIWRRMDYIRKLGNTAAHSGKPITEEQAVLCLENLFVFLDCVAYLYAPKYTEREFDHSLLTLTVDEALAYVPDADIDIAALMAENKSLREELTARRAEQQQTYVPKPLDLSEYKTRKLYIDVMLQDAGWVEGRDWLNEVELHGMPSKSGEGRADYVLYGDDGRPLAVLEAKSSCTDVTKGRQQAEKYADCLEKQYGRRPIIFLSNGFDTRIWNDKYSPERKVAAVYSKRDLEKLYNLQTMRTSLRNVVVNKSIAGRYYQEGAIKAVCESLDAKNRRKALLVMATGSGKTRTVIALCDVLLQHGWVKNILFLADRNSLVTQAKRAFVNMLPDLSVTNLCEDKENYDARCVFSTYQTMMNCIDAVRDENDRKLYTVGHFDLVIVDEAHRSIYNKYRDIFTYFDAPLVGLTATPKDEIDKNTYEIFELESGVPTYGYELAQAVKDGFLVDFMSVESKLKFIESGITYEDLPQEEREEYENTFTGENGEIPDHIDSSALNEWVFNEDTIKQVLHILMQDGLRIDYGEKLGKTIIFAKNHAHAEKIHEIFGKEYPHLPGYTKVIDNYMTYAQSAIDDFSDPKKLPQIAISVDMLDTGIDVPDVLNLVFFKKVMSKAKFWQMIGRGTRRCDGLIDGKDKDKFYIFDFCGNFEFFRMFPGKPTANQMALQGAIFRLKAQIAFSLQDVVYQTPELIEFRKTLVDDMVRKVREL